MDEARAKYEGACHCGALSIRYESAAVPETWSVRACQCSFCRLHAALSTSDPGGSLAFSATDRADVQRYRFGMRTADFLICRRCGVYVGATFAAATGRFGIVNLRTLRHMPDALPSPASMHYDDQSPAARALRREARWTTLSVDSL